MISPDEKIKNAVMEIKKTIPPDVILQAAAKTRSLEEVEAVIQAGVVHIGYNYVQESLPIIQKVGKRAIFHMIGHLQRNKAKTVVANFDIIETVDSIQLAQDIDRHAKALNKIMPVLIEVNSGREDNKTGVLPEEVEDLAIKISELKSLRLEGLMTMGPRFGNPDDSRVYFSTTRKIFERLSEMDIPNVNLKWLSMGMSNSYQIAIEEGANIIRIGTKLFGER